MIKAADMMIARRADTKARADFATWKMMAKLNGASALPTEAQAFLAGYKTLLKDMPEPEATEATIQLVYRRYYARNGRAPAYHPTSRPIPAIRSPATSRPSGARRPQRPKPAEPAPHAKPRLRWP